MAFTFFGPAFQRVRLASGLITLLARSYNPRVQAPWFGLFRFRSPLLSESRLIYFPPGTEMVHFPGLARTRLCIQRVVARFCRAGFPHSDIPGSKPVCGFPRLIAAYHVLHRLLAPRHPPYALSSLTIKLTQHVVLRQYGLSRPDIEHEIPQEILSPRSACRGKLAFPQFATLEQKFAVYCATRTLTSAQRNASFLQLSKSNAPIISFRSGPLRSRRSAESVWSRCRGK
jgi:hypothetical protein